jgi:hypothetical protein
MSPPKPRTPFTGGPAPPHTPGGTGAGVGGVAPGAGGKPGNFLSRNKGLVLGAGVGAAMLVPGFLGGPGGALGSLLVNATEGIAWLLEHPQEAIVGGIAVAVGLHYL